MTNRPPVSRGKPVVFLSLPRVELVSLVLLICGARGPILHPYRAQVSLGLFVPGLALHLTVQVSPGLFVPGLALKVHDGFLSR